MQGLDKIVHSAIGLGFYLSFIVTLDWRVLLGLICVSVGKEVIDYLRYGDFDEHDIYATLNPLIVINWYIELIKK